MVFFVFFLQGRVGIKLGRAGNDLLILPLIMARRFLIAVLYCKVTLARGPQIAQTRKVMNS